MRAARILPIAFVCLLTASLRADEDDEPRPVGMRPTDWEAGDFGARREGVLAMASDYMAFLGANKTEREVVAAATKLARDKGFAPAPDRAAVAIRPGQKLVFSAHGKIAALV